MRKITLLFVLALALVLAIPGLAGQLVRTRHEALVGALAANFQGGTLTDSRYEPGWFTSRVRHRIEFEGPAWVLLEEGLTGRPGGDGRPALVIDSRLAHGPWPGGGSGPAFMTAVSRLSLTGSDGLTLDIPGEVRTTVGLTGHGTARFLSPGLDRTLGVGEGRFNWDGADVTVGFDAGGETLDSAGRFGRLVLSNPDGELVLGDVELATRSRRSDFGFWTGTSDIRVDRMEAIAPDGSVFACRALHLDGTVEEADGLMAFRFALTAQGLEAAALVDTRLDAEIFGTRLDAAEWGRYLAIRRAGGGDAVDFERLVRAGPEIGLRRLAMTSPDGDLNAAVSLAVPPGRRVRGPLTALGAATGEGALTVSPGLLARLAQSSEPLLQAAQMLLALGYLREEDGSYAGRFRLERGRLEVNGVTLDLPGLEAG